jgi:hypothetical protein
MSSRLISPNKYEYVGLPKDRASGAIDRISKQMRDAHPSCCVLAGAVLLVCIAVQATAAGIGCPPTHDGKPLKSVELFEGPPENKFELMPADGRFDVPQVPRSLWDRYPPFTLGCTYRGSNEMVAVELLRSVRVCRSEIIRTSNAIR